MNKKMRTLLFVGVVVILMAFALIFYGLSRGVYDEFSAEKVNNGLTAESDPELWNWYIVRHRVLAFLAYLFSILTLVGFGVCLHISDKLREKEDKKVEVLEAPVSPKEDEDLVTNLEKEALDSPVQ